MNGKTIKCKVCGADMEKNVKICPQCSAKNTKPIIKRWWFWVIIVVVALGIIGSLNDTPSANTDSAQTASENTGDESDVAATTQEPAENVPAEYKSALRKADSYANSMNMSKAGVYDQLVSEYGEQFSNEAAQYAIDNVKADWKACALAKAESYSDTMNMSKTGVYDQLISENGEKFTEEEAQYAIDNIKADWKANALAKAKSYQESMDMSPTSIHDQLVSEYGEKFTSEEADYAIQHLND
ncbi:MAG: Ltp family lipoprotein [Aminipila sp.]